MGGDVVDHCLVLNKYDSYDEVQGVSSVPDNPGSIDSYAPLEVSEKEYDVWVARESGMDIDDEHVAESNVVSTLDTQVILEKATPEYQFDQFSQAANVRPPLSQQRVSNKGPSLNQSAGPSVLNVQLNYNPDQALDPDSWDSNFHTVSLYSAMEHIPSDVLISKNLYLECTNTC